MRYRKASRAEPVSDEADHEGRAMTLTGRQIRQLRSLAHHLDPVVTIGKGGVSDATAEQAVAALEAHELIKCAVLDNSGLDARSAAEDLAGRVDAEIVQVIGRKFSLYRESSRTDIEKIELA